MIDLRLIREQPDLVRRALEKRNMDPALVSQILAADEARRQTLTDLENLRNRRNTMSKAIGRMKPEERDAAKDEVRQVNVQIEALDARLAENDARLGELAAQVPNLPDEGVPLGKDEHDNVVRYTVGEKRSFDFEPLAHWDLGPRLGIIDFEAGARLSGSRFYVLRKGGAQLERALIQWMLDLHLEQGYTEVYTPFMVKEATMFASGQLPKFRDNLFHDVERDAWFVPTAEVPVTGLHADEVLSAGQLPLAYVAYTPCFRKEPMSAGRDVRGIKRGFQFDKVEMYWFCKPEESVDLLEKLTLHAEQTCAALGLAYRRVELCTGDLGFGARHTYDIEVWAPGVQEWLEVSSCSNVGEFQARRANIRFRREAGARPEFVHTLNGSGLGLPRTLIAVLENYQQADGSIVVPEALHPYVKKDVIR